MDAPWYEQGARESESIWYENREKRVARRHHDHLMYYDRLLVEACKRLTDAGISFEDNEDLIAFWEATQEQKTEDEAIKYAPPATDDMLVG